MHASWEDHWLETKLYLAPQKIPVISPLVCMAKQLMRKKAKGLIVSWGASHMALPASRERWLSHSLLYWHGFASSSVCTSVWHNVRRTAKCVQRRANKVWKVSRAKLMRINLFVHLGEEKAEEWTYHSLRLTIRRAVGQEVLSSSLVIRERTQRNGMELHQGKFKMDTRKRFFIERVIGLLNRLLREVVMAPNLSEFKKHQDDALSHDLILGSPVRRRELDTMICMGPFHLEMFWFYGLTSNNFGF